MKDATRRPILSASNLSAAALCPGKPNLEAQFAELPDTEESRRGTALHRYFRTGRPLSELSPDDQLLMHAAHRHADEFIEQFRNTVGLAADEVFFEEHEIELQGTVPGHPDDILTWRSGEFVAVLDLKSGMGEVDHAQDNYQLSAYSALIWQREPFKQCGVCIVQPDAFGPRMTSALYTAEQMPDVIAEIERIAASTVVSDAPRVPSAKACKWCRAVTACPEYRAQLTITEPMPLAVESLTNDKLVEVDTAIRFGEKIKDDVRSEMRRRVEVGSLPGFKLRNTGDVTTLIQPTEFFVELRKSMGTKLTASEFDSCRKMEFGALARLIAAKLGIAKSKAEEMMKTIAEPFVKKVPKEKAVVEDK